MPSAPPAVEEAAAIVDALTEALRTGDASAVRRLMAQDIVIAESGGIERSFDEYAAHHMPADMAFTAATTSTLQERKVIRSQDMAIVISQYELRGTFQDRPIHSRTTETAVVSRDGGQWRIHHIHWSSSPISQSNDH